MRGVARLAALAAVLCAASCARWERGAAVPGGAVAARLPAGPSSPPRAAAPQSSGGSTEPAAVVAHPPSDVPDSPPRAGAPHTPTTRPAGKVLFSDTFTQGPDPSPARWLVRNPSKARMVVESGALVVRSEARGEPAKVELQVQEALPALGAWSLEFDALVNSLWGRGLGEVRVELRDAATRNEPQGSDFVLAERHWQAESGLKFGVFHGGAFVGWHEVAPLGQLGAWHHYRVDYEGGVVTLWRDGERALECDIADLLDRPLTEGVVIEMGFHVPEGSGVEGCIDNVTVVAHEDGGPVP